VPAEVELLFPRRRAAGASPVAISPPALATARWGLFRVPLAEDRKLKALPEDNLASRIVSAILRGVVVTAGAAWPGWLKCENFTQDRR
jgi:hypothetical protein